MNYYFDSVEAALKNLNTNEAGLTQREAEKRLLENGKKSIAQLKAEGANPRLVFTVLRNNDYGWFEEAGKNTYKLTPGGVRALSEHSEVIGTLKVEPLYPVLTGEREDLAFKRELILAWLLRGGPATPGQLVKLGADAKTAGLFLTNNARKWFRKAPGTKKYELTEAGRDALKANAALVEEIVPTIDAAHRMKF